MHLSELKSQHVSELITMGEALEIENVARLRKQELMFAIMKKRAKAGEQVFGDGVLEVLPDGFGFLRSIEASYMASTDELYLTVRGKGAHAAQPHRGIHLVEYTREALQEVAGHVVALSAAEDLPAHGDAVRVHKPREGAAVEEGERAAPVAALVGLLALAGVVGVVGLLGLRVVG